VGACERVPVRRARARARVKNTRFVSSYCRHFFSVSSRRGRRASGIVGPLPPPPSSPVHRLTARTRPAPRAARRRRRRRAISPPRRSRA